MNQQSFDQADNEMADDVLARAIRSIEAGATPPGPPPELVAATLRSLDAMREAPMAVPRVRPRRRAMKLAAMAASVLLIVSLATLWMPGFKSPPSAFAQALRQMREARMMSYSMLTVVEGRKPSDATRVYVADDNRRRMETPGAGKSLGTVTIFDANNRIRLVLMESTKTALVYEAKQGRATPAGNWFVDWLEALKKLSDKPDKELGQAELDGRQVTGFVATQGTFTFTMWVDRATGQVVRIESASQANPAAKNVMTDFRFDQAVDESLFSTALPRGYTVVRPAERVGVAGGEVSVVEALRGYCKRADGKFPPSLTRWADWLALVDKNSRDGAVDVEGARVMEHLGAILPFLAAMPKQNYAYLGDGRTLGEQDAIVFWYKKPDGTYRAVYGDLSTKDIAAGELPKP